MGSCTSWVEYSCCDGGFFLEEGKKGYILDCRVEAVFGERSGGIIGLLDKLHGILYPIVYAMYAILELANITITE